MSLPVYDGITPLLDEYDGFIIDLWGVVHDGAQLFPGALDALRLLDRRAKSFVFVTNAPRRVAPIVELLTGFGIPGELARNVLSSGELVYEELASRRSPDFARLGRTFFHLGPERDRNVFESLTGYKEVETPETADFVLNTGPWDLEAAEETFDPILSACAARNLPMVCANPDKVIVREGRMSICAGALAVRYERMGCEVIWRGKPDAAVFHAAVARLGVTPAKALVIGDSFTTDLAGADAALLDSVLVTGGIHARELAAEGQPVDGTAVQDLARLHGLFPEAAIHAFRP